MATLSSAFLGNENVFHVFKFNPLAVNWGYSENTRSIDTLGGRVVQVLSAKIEKMSVACVAGSRTEMQRVAKDLQNIMNYHIRTQEPVSFKVPSRNWNFLVYLETVSQLGWNVQTVVYPYQINLSVMDDLTGIKSKEIDNNIFNKFALGIGYNPDVHGGDAPAFSDLVNNLNLSYTNQNGQNGDGVTEGEETTVGSGSGTTLAGGTVNTSGTDAIRKVYKYVFDKYPKAKNAGIYVCKKIVDSNTYSQHSWANALDIKAENDDTNYLNAIASDLLSKARAGTLPIAQILWQKKNLLSGNSVYDHTDHIHISGDPMYSGIPPCAGG